MTNKLNITTPF